MKSKQVHRLLIISSLILIASLSIIIPSTLQKITISPDENYNYLLMKEYSKSGKLYIEKDYTQYDVENLLHPRQLVSYNDKQVPFNYFGLPLFYGTFYIFFEDYIKYISFFLAVMSSIYIVKISDLIFSTEKSFTWIAIISCTPLIYYYNQPYFNVTLALVFFIVATYYLLKYVKFDFLKYLVLASIFFSTSIFIRNNYIIWAALFLFATLWLKYKDIKNVAMARDILISFTFLLFIFFIPLLLINYSLYDNPFTYSFSLFYLIYPSTSLNLNTSSMLTLKPLMTFLFPSDFDAIILIKNIYRLTFGLMPAYSIVALIGIISIIKEKHFKIDKYYLIYIFMMVYILIYRGSAYTWKSYDYDYFGFNTSIIRYWLIFYLFTIFLVTKGLYEVTKKHRRFGVVICALLLITSITNLVITNEHSLQTEKNILQSSEHFANVIIENIDNKSIVYSDYGDKMLSPYNIEVASWWSQADTYDPQKIVNSMERIYYNTNYTVYLLKTQDYIKIDELNTLLLKSNLTLVKTEYVSPKIELYVLYSSD